MEKPHVAMPVMAMTRFEAALPVVGGSELGPDLDAFEECLIRLLTNQGWPIGAARRPWFDASAVYSKLGSPVEILGEDFTHCLRNHKRSTV